MNWCCIGFESSHGVAGERGFSIIVNSKGVSGKPRFYLQHRSIDENDDITKYVHDEKKPISLISEIVIHYCPFAEGDWQNGIKTRLMRLIIQNWG